MPGWSDDNVGMADEGVVRAESVEGRGRDSWRMVGRAEDSETLQGWIVKS